MQNTFTIWPIVVFTKIEAFKEEKKSKMHLQFLSHVIDANPEISLNNIVKPETDKDSNS